MPILARQRGFSLVELMVASTIGLVLLTALISLFLSSKAAHNDTGRRGFLYDNGRYAMAALSEELRLADFWGAARPTDIINHAQLDAITADCSGNAAGYGYTNALWANTAASAAVAVCMTNTQISSDVLFVKHVAATPVAAASINAARTYLAANATKAILFDGADAPPTTVTGGDVPNGQFWEYVATAYYVSTEAAGLPTLVRRRLAGSTWSAAEEVAAGVERVRLLFGVDSSGDGAPDSYVNAAAADWNNVVAVKIYLLMRSAEVDPTYADTKTYQLGDITVDPSPDDGYHRTVFDTTVSLRNRRLLMAGGF